MKRRILSSEIEDFIGKKIFITGWLHEKGTHNKATVFSIRDRHGIILIVDDESKQSKKINGLQNGSIISIEGTVVKKYGTASQVEIHNPQITVDLPVKYVAPVDINKRISHNSKNLKALFDNRVLTLRNITESDIWKIQEAVENAAVRYLKLHDFTEFHSPKILPASVEDDSKVFKLDYFGKQASLSDTTQFYKQILTGSLERVFEIAPTYRAEAEITSRHMSEFITIDTEIAFIDGLQDLKVLIASLINYISREVWKESEPKLLALRSTKPLLKEKLPEVTLQELHRLYLREKGKDLSHKAEPTPEEENFISEYSAKHWRSEAVFITEFPANGMGFYDYKNEKNPKTIDRADLIFRGIEILTTRRREHRYPILMKQLKESGKNPKDVRYKYLLQAVKYGMPSHGGFGLGLERLTAKIIGLKNVKEVSLF